MTPDLKQRDEIALLRSFNKRVAKLERGSLAKRWSAKEPEVMIKFDGPLSITRTGSNELSLGGKITSWVPDFDEGEVDAFVLTYRVLTQNNDRLSISKIAQIYHREWMHPDAVKNFDEARQYLNDYLGSAATIEFGAHQVSIREIVDIVLYGGLAHSNKKKEKVFEAWTSNPAMSGLIWVEFLAAMNKGLYVCSFFKRLNETVIDAYDIAIQSN